MPARSGYLSPYPLPQTHTHTHTHTHTQPQCFSFPLAAHMGTRLSLDLLTLGWEGTRPLQNHTGAGSWDLTDLLLLWGGLG